MGCHEACLWPLGPLALEAYCRDLAEFRAINMNWYHKIGTPENESGLYLSNLPDWDPDIVGISSTFDLCFNSTVLLSGVISEKYPNAVQVIGGHMVTDKWSDILYLTEAEACCIGEGEKAFRSYLETGEFSHPSWKTIRSSDEKILDDIDPNDVPCYDFDIYDVKPSGSIQISLSSGCFGRCYFCTLGASRLRRAKHKGVVKMMDELLEYNRKWNITKFFVVDDCPFEDKPYFRSILSFMKENNFKAHFFNLPFFNVETEEDCKLIASVDFEQWIGISPDCSCERVHREITEKRGSWSHVKDVVRWCRKYGLKVLLVILVGFPEETKDEIEGIVETYRDIEADHFGVRIVCPLPGSDFAEDVDLRKPLDILGKDYPCGPQCYVDGVDWTGDWLEMKVPILEQSLNVIAQMRRAKENYQIS